MRTTRKSYLSDDIERLKEHLTADLTGELKKAGMKDCSINVDIDISVVIDVDKPGSKNREYAMSHQFINET